MLSSYSHLRLYALGNIGLMVLMIFALISKQWAEVNGLEYSLREINFRELGGWVETGKFKQICTHFNMVKFPDLKEDCQLITNFEVGGILVLNI
jgi:hypothetical protein